MAILNFSYDLTTSLLVFLLPSLKLLSLDYFGVRLFDVYLISIGFFNSLTLGTSPALIVPYSLFTTFFWVLYDFINAQHLNSF